MWNFTRLSLFFLKLNVQRCFLLVVLFIIKLYVTRIGGYTELEIYFLVITVPS